jgi:hypothetical protein
MARTSSLNICKHLFLDGMITVDPTTGKERKSKAQVRS